jgi:hypothetical protein
MIEHFPNVGKDMDIQTQEAYRTQIEMIRKETGTKTDP